MANHLGATTERSLRRNGSFGELAATLSPVADSLQVGSLAQWLPALSTSNLLLSLTRSEQTHTQREGTQIG